MPFDVFLSHNNRDKPSVRKLAELLKGRGLAVWLDEWELVPGRVWQEALEEVINTTHSVVVLIGSDGIGPWQMPEMRAALSKFVEKGLPVIPVLLPDAPARIELPLFLRNFTWVDFRKGFSTENLERLIWGITGNKLNVLPTPEHMEKFANQHDPTSLRAENSATSEQTADLQFFSLGNDAFAKKEWDTAICNYTKTIKQNPKLVSAYHNRALAFFNKGDFRCAIQDCTEAIRLAPNDAVHYASRANIFVQTGDLTGAVDDFSQAIRLEPKNAIFYQNRAIAYSKIGDFDSAIKDLSDALRIKPNHFYYFQRSSFYLKKGDYESAIRDLEQAHRSGPDEKFFEIAGMGDIERKFCKSPRFFKDILPVLIQYNRGIMYEKRQDFLMAAGAFQSCIELLSSMPDAKGPLRPELESRIQECRRKAKE